MDLTGKKVLVVGLARTGVALTRFLAEAGARVTVTDLAVLRQHWLFLVVLFIFVVVLSQLWLGVHYVTTSGGYRSERRSFWGEALWSGGGMAAVTFCGRL